MKHLCEEYVLANTIDEAVQSLSGGREATRIIAGGSDLLLELQQGTRAPVHTLVDVTGIEEMCALEVRDSSLFLGAAVTLSRLASSGLIRQHAQALTDAAALMANPQVCNVATIGGNVAHALPAADGTIALLALGAEAEVAHVGGRRRVPLQWLFKGPGESTLDLIGGVLVGFYLPLHQEGQASAFVRRVNPQGIALALLNMAIWLERMGNCIKDIRIAVGPSGPVPRRMVKTEEMLTGWEPSNEVEARAMQALLNEASFRTSPHRATSEYRTHIAEVLFQEALSQAWQRSEFKWAR
jgi:carbon-monoxide dehydrogenase medium subunit